MTERSVFAVRNFRHLLAVFLSRYLEPHVIRFVTIAVLLMGLINLLIACLTIDDDRNAYGSYAGADYSCFYVAGSLLNNYPAEQLYNFDLQSDLYHALLPGVPEAQEIPFVNPPFFALLFRPLSMLPYLTSYLTWIALSTILYVAGFELLRRALGSLPAASSSISLLLALSFAPFLLESAIGGNSSAFGFFAVALALYFERRNNPTASGIALALCFYKPTLLVLILPMLLVGRRFRTLLGVAVGGTVLAAISILIAGWESSLGYVRMLLNLSQMTVGAEEVFRTWKYVDLMSFSRLLLGTDNSLTWVLAGVSALVVIPILIRTWWTIDDGGENRRDLIWASTITWTLVLNLHVGIYDSILVVASLLLIAGVLYRRATDPSTAMDGPFRSLLVFVYLTPLFTQHIAKWIGFQPFTLILAAAAVYPLLLLVGYPLRGRKVPASQSSAV
ncbi:MAG: DUF2029 domain-containing protein [Rhodothermia bacterium]|nr:DUF2029 domain-containing protein [Rhodothermia bacterium]